jgi:hypothetical protein
MYAEFSVGKSEGKGTSGRNVNRCEDIIKMDLKKEYDGCGLSSAGRGHE